MTTEQLGEFQFSYEPPAFPLGGDSLALGRFATVKKGWRVCDLGTGSGVLLLLLAERQLDLKLMGIELESHSAQLAQYNLTQNGLKGQILQGDFREKLLPAGQFDLIISNPPYFSLQSGAVKNGARSEKEGSLQELCQSASRLVKNGGRFALVHRPERLVDVFVAMRSVNIEPKRMKFLAHSPQHTPSAVVVEGVRQGRPGLSIEV